MGPAGETRAGPAESLHRATAVAGSGGDQSALPERCVSSTPGRASGTLHPPTTDPTPFRRPAEPGW